jgi:hypothetical protein
MRLPQQAMHMQLPAVGRNQLCFIPHGSRPCSSPVTPPLMFASPLPRPPPTRMLHHALVLRRASSAKQFSCRPLPPLPTPLHPRPPQHELRRAFVRPHASSANHLSRHRVEPYVGLLRTGHHLHSTIAVGPSSTSRKMAGATNALVRPHGVAGPSNSADGTMS